MNMNIFIKHWNKEAKDGLVGRKIVRISRYTGPDADFTNQLVIHLDDGQQIYASRDEEGNGMGVIFTNKRKGIYV